MMLRLMPKRECMQKLLINIWKCIKTWEFAYLAIFFLAEFLTLVIANPSRIILYIPLLLLIVSYIIKLSILIFKHKIKLSQFFRMQLDFISPYVLMVINVVLAGHAISTINSFELFKLSDLHLVEFGSVLTMILVVGTMICSLIMNKKTTKFQLFTILLIIIMQTGSNLNTNVSLILSLNTLNDEIEQLKLKGLLALLSGETTPEKYATFYELVKQFSSTMDNAKDFLLALVASTIAQLTIMIDLIFRPLQKLEQSEEIHQGLLRNLGIEQKTKGQVELTEEKKEQIDKSAEVNC